MRISISYGKILPVLVILVVIFIQFFSKRKSKLPSFVIDLDKEPRERWREVAEKYASSFQMGLKPFLAWYEKKFNLTYEELKRNVEYLSQQFPHEYREEIIGLANYAKVNEIMMFLVQLRFDFSTVSTTVVCTDDEDKVWVFRSVDCPIGNAMKLLAISVDFQRANRSVFKGTTFAGLVGLASGVLRDRYSIFADHRQKNKPPDEGFETAKQQVSSVGNVWPASILLRQLLDKSEACFEDVVRELSTFPLMAPFYFIVAGRQKDEGVIITRDRNELVKLRSLDVANGQWFLIATNREVKTETSTQDPTCKAVENAMIKMTRFGVSEENAEEVLKLAESTSTVFTTVMSISSYLDVSLLSYLP